MNIFKLREDGLSIKSIGKILDLDRKTISKYLKNGRNNLPVSRTRKRKKSKLDEFRGYIDTLLARGIQYSESVSAVFIYRRIKKRGYTGSVSLVRKYVQKQKEKRHEKLVPVIPTIPGKEAQVDWGEKFLRDKNGRRTKVYIFEMTLSHSGTKFSILYPKANQYYFLKGHIEALKYFGGVPESVLYDQTRCAIDKPGFSKVEWNKRFYDFATYYGFFPKACKPYNPQRKGRVESSVKDIKRSFLTLRVFEGFEKLNTDCSNWLKERNSRVHSIKERIPFDLLQEELPFMTALPERHYELYQLESRRVMKTSTVSFRNKYYSVPPAYLGQVVTVKFKPETDKIKIFSKEKLLCAHMLAVRPGKYVILPEHQEEISQIIRNRFSMVSSRRKKYKPDNPDQFVKRNLSFYEEVSK